MLDMSDNDHGTNDESETNRCICGSERRYGFWIVCNYCEIRYHFVCVGMTERKAKGIEKYSCSRCHEKDRTLKTTYKADQRTTKNFKEGINRSSKHSTPLVNVGPDEAIPFREYSTFKNSKSVSKESDAISSQTISGYKANSKPKVCHKLGYAEAADRENFLDYIDDDGRAPHEIRRLILSRHANQRRSSPSATDVQFERNLTGIEAEKCSVQRELEAVDIRIVKLIKKINDAKKPGNDFKEFDNEDTTLVKCVLCEGNLQNKLIANHLKDCFMRHFQKYLIPENMKVLHDVQWNVYCGYSISKREHCKNLKALCREHGNFFRKDDEVCGYALEENVYCGNVGKTCCHTDWEVFKRALLDLDKVKLIVKLAELNNKEREVTSMERV